MFTSSKHCKRLFGNTKFLLTLWQLAAPVALQHLVIFSLGMVDTVMIGQLGKVEIAGVSIANQFHFLLILLLFGISSGVSVFTAQYFGKGDTANIRRMTGIGLIAGITGGLCFFLTAFIRPEWIMKIYSRDTAVIATGCLYLRITSFSYICTAITIIFSVVLRSMRQVKMPLAVSTAALVSNTLLNYILIFGKLGFPVMGVKGAAIATLISRAMELGLLLYLLYSNRNVLAGSIREFTDLTMDLVKKCFKTAMPVVINEFGWGLGTAAFSVVYARISTDAVASFNISEQAMNLSMVMLFGTCMACSVMTGNSIGAGKSSQAIHNGRKFLALGTLLGLCSGILIIIFSPLIPKLFNVSDQIRLNSHYILFTFGLVVTFKSMNFHLIVGILRGGGDTTWGMMLDICGMWLVGLPLAFAGAFYFHLPVYLVYALASTEEIVKFFFGIYRFRSGKWIRDLVN
ncbi:MAG: MATE family efflux transporter [Candidatus Wallbacteria bacterium HGW-Wallbacteria-1]|jgi:putative MATE family efflux protein|uniref:MATE family efflux transporter n=1 Tax=Candidatus Wallbacteria bacterium HGW-Wallbacteria-1 TaxID=2013854 RepID=A0A2N1PLB9_9BACT|nr:MAG: MATE family efflux transporter [Candidatus Wallbacteria bacterium HGW-Wallbacteria-1]